MDSFVYWPVWQVVVVCILTAAIPPVVQWWLIFKSPLREDFKRYAGVEPAMIGAVAILFGLFAAFLANDIWTRNLTAQQAVINEADGIRTLARYAEGMSARSNEQVRTALTDYARTVIDKDWPKMAEGSRSRELLAKVRALSQMLITGEVGKEAGPAIQGRMIDAYTQIRDNRQTRVQIAESRTLTIKWHALVIFGLLTQLAIAIVHINRPHPAVLAQLVFGLAFAACLSILLINEFPFSPMNPVSAEPLQKALESLTR